MKWYLKVLKQFADFNGRARRQEYWMFSLFNFLFLMAAGMLDRLLNLASPTTGLGPLYGLYILAVFIPGIAVSIRRLHDVGKNGWMLLLALIPFIGAIWLLILMVREGDRGENMYGPDPKSNSIL